MSFFKDILNVAKRETSIMFSRPLYMIATVVVMLLCCFFFATIMQKGVPERMPIAVVDLDKTTTSRNVIHQLNSMQMVQVTKVCNSYAEARDMLQRGDIYGFMLIPRGFYNKLAGLKRPTLSVYTNNTYTVGANMAYKQLLTMCNLVAGALQLEVFTAVGLTEEQAMTLIQPIVMENHQIGNPKANYAIYLVGTILPGILGLIVLTTTVFSIGLELKDKTSREWLDVAGGSMPVALIGKLLPYNLIYLALGICCNMLLFEVMDLPVAGSFLLMSLAMLVYVCAMQAIAVLFIGLIPTVRTALSISALYGMLAFSMSGFTYPPMAMLPAFRALTWLFPLGHYYHVYANEALLNGPIENTILPMIWMLLALIPQLFIVERLRYAAINLNYSPK